MVSEKHDRILCEPVLPSGLRWVLRKNYKLLRLTWWSFLPEASFGLRVLSSPASVGLCVRVCVCINHEHVRTITHRPFKLGSPNLDQRCKTPWFGSLLFLGMIDLDLQGQIVTSKSNFTPFWACSHHYSSAIQARITKFGPKMHLSTVKIPTNFGLDWFRSSLSFSILKPIFLPNLFAPFLYIFSETRRL